MTSQSEAPPAYRSPSPDAASYTPQTSSKNVGPVATFDDKSAKAKDLGEIKSSTSNPATSSKTVSQNVTAAAAAVSNAVPTSIEELKAQLAQAQATIASYGQEGGLRMRKAVGGGKSESATDGATDLNVQLASGGVPVQVVAALCLLSFLLAYFLF